MLMRFDPFRELDRLTAGVSRSHGLMAMDAYRHGDTFTVQFDLPGANADTIDVSVEKNVLTVKASRSWSRAEGDDVVVAERQQGEFTRQLFLGDSLDAAKVHAGYENGVLTLTIPVAEKAKPRRVEIETPGAAKPVEANATPVGASAN